MSATRSLFGRACGVYVSTGVFVWVALLLCASTAPVVAAERVLFSAPLHITRELSDPLSQKTSVIDEYCQGNRVVSVSGSRTAIADYGRGELTEIDFNAGTYSVTKFEQLARLYVQEKKEKKDADARRVVRSSADRELTFNRGAIEALLGIGYPYPQNDGADVVLGSLRSRDHKVATTAAEVDEYQLPLEQVMRHDVGGESVETRNVVTRIGHELAPVDALAIPSGAKLVESKSIAARRLLEELDRPPSTSSGN
jgi:hypothetical protein